MSKCQREECNNECPPSKGKKPTRYCSNNCRQIAWQKSKKARNGAENALGGIISETSKRILEFIEADPEKDKKVFSEQTDNSDIGKSVLIKVFPIGYKTPMPYKEGGLYRFEKGQFVEYKKPEYPLTFGEVFDNTLPEGKIEFKPENLKSYDDGDNIKEKKRLLIEKEPPSGDRLDIDEIEKKLKEIEAEEIPKDRNTALGRKSWAKEQQKRIQELKNQLK